MTRELFCQAILKFFSGVLLVGLLLFLPAGTLDWPGAWLFMGLLFLSMPLVLGSPVSEGIFLIYPLLLVRRIRNEEEVLERELEGYTAYKEKVRYKMIPLVW